ncbi:ABC transporter permease [Chitinophaga japonensis]|uniref:Putative permease n=1 Tax=Chitinophaga japonensis TaxID=104662 RepID=A0A562TAQ1_CHIJA|nr:ABC transporter permease [Chitinophaga japonensis]TWI90727.1 putative permease [Chitinophaga japonensis]
MIKNYCKIAWRNLVRNKAFSVINISGLALGLACSLLIMLWVQDERRVDGFHANGKLLYQVYERSYYDGQVDAAYYTQGLLARELKSAVPEVQYASALERNWPATLSVGDKVSKIAGASADADFFKMFSYPILAGAPATALHAPGLIAVSHRIAEAFFGSPANAIGKTLRFDNRLDLQVSAVFENLPANASQKFEFLRSWDDYIKENPWVNNWSNTSPGTLVQLRPDADPAKVEARIKDFIYRYRKPEPGNRVELGLQPYPEKYLHSTFKNGQVDGGRIEYVRLFSLVAVFILLIACINFMNLATARSAKRAKEVGVRKVIGAARTALIAQFIGEALLLTCFAIVAALLLVWLLLPAFNALTGKQLALPVGQPVFWAALAGLLLLTGMVAGSYPALFLSSLSPVRVLKGTLKFSMGAVFFRKGLVVFQFALSVMLMISMIVIYRQMDYIQHKNLGYDRENLLYIPVEGNLVNKYELFREEARKVPGVLAISKMKESPTVIGHHRGDIEWQGKPDDLATSFADATVGYDFVETMGLKVKVGRGFSRAYGADSTSYMINETALEKTGYRDPIGKPMWWGGRRGTIIGILEDFHINSMHQAIEPLILRVDENIPWGTILIRIRGGKTKEALAGLEQLCKTLNPQFPFTYTFSDLEFAQLYRSEQVVSKLAGIFAFLAIFISCLGLFGLAAFTAEQRTKEIGIRKVLGASVQQIVARLSASFLKPVALAMIIAFPIAWYAMDRWLQDFAYRIHVEWWMFVLAGLLTAGIALLTVSFQSIKAAIINPVKSLRAE